MSVQLVSEIANLCDHSPPTSQTDGQTDRQTCRRTDGRTTCDRKTALCTVVHCAVKKLSSTPITKCLISTFYSRLLYLLILKPFPIYAVCILSNVTFLHCLINFVTTLFVVNSAAITYNAALNRPAYQSSLYTSEAAAGPFTADRANDGSRHTRYNTGTRCAVTNYTDNPWWAVDLGQPMTIYKVYLTGNDHRKTSKCMYS